MSFEASKTRPVVLGVFESPVLVSLRLQTLFSIDPGNLQTCIDSEWVAGGGVHCDLWACIIIMMACVTNSDILCGRCGLLSMHDYGAEVQHLTLTCTVIVV